MRKIVLIVLVVLLSFSTLAYAEEEKEKKKESICPISKINADCLQCHVLRIKDGKPVFGLKEIKQDAYRQYPSGTQVIDGKGYYLVGEITNGESNLIRDHFDYLKSHNIKYTVFDVHSPGGSLFAAWRIKGLMDEFESEGGIIETRTRGFAASAGAILFVAGTKGYRIINAQAEIMFHELWSVKFLDISTPADKEDEARVLRHLQDTISSWLATRGKLSKDELDQRMRKKEFWLSGKEAFENGFADKLVGN